MNFKTILEAHHALYKKESIEPEEMAESRLNLIREAKKSYESKNSAEAIYWYGKCLATGEEAFPINVEESIKYLNQAIMMRSMDAQVMLGDFYSAEISGIDEEMTDMDKAVKHYTTASESGDGYASFRLANIYSGELGYSKDIRQALNYLDKSIEQKSDDGLCLKAYWSYNGDLINKDLDMIIDIAEQIMDRAEKYDNFEAMDTLSKISFLYGLLVFHGEGIEENQEAGIEFIKDAANFGDFNAIEWIRDYNIENA